MALPEADTTARREPNPGARGQRFAAAMGAVVRRLPFGLARVVPPTLLGYLLINGFTFSVDLTLLTAFHGGLHWPLPLAITCSYATANALSYFLNRILNFRSHAAVGPQLGWYLPVVIVNYLAWVLGVGDGLTALGLDYRLSRIAAGVCEAVYMYCAMRWVVFRDTGRRAP
jgi:putative flippase GtrA